MKYYIILGSPRDGQMTRPFEEHDTKPEAEKRVEQLREQGEPAYVINGMDYLELTGHYASVDYKAEVEAE